MLFSLAASNLDAGARAERGERRGERRGLAGARGGQRGRRHGVDGAEEIGANLTNKKFSRDLDQVIQRAREAGVTKIMVTGTSIHSTKEALRLTRLYPNILYSTAGNSNNNRKIAMQIFVGSQNPNVH